MPTFPTGALALATGFAHVLAGHQYTSRGTRRPFLSLVCPTGGTGHLVGSPVPAPTEPHSGDRGVLDVSGPSS